MKAVVLVETSHGQWQADFDSETKNYQKNQKNNRILNF